MGERIYATGMAYRLRSQWDRDQGLGQNHNAVKFLGQDFERLKAQSVQSGRLFEDTYFPATVSSLGFNELGPRSSKTSGVRWLRPPVSPSLGPDHQGSVLIYSSSPLLFFLLSLLTNGALIMHSFIHFESELHSLVSVYPQLFKLSK